MDSMIRERIFRRKLAQRISGVSFAPAGEVTCLCGTSPRAFTLIELLVVVSITAVLMALLLPAVGRMRVEGQVAVCAGNLRQIASGAQLYAGENSMRLPGNPDTPNGSVVGWSTSPSSWPSEILPYAGGDPRIFVSPALPKFRNPGWPQYADQLTPVLPGSSYMLNGQVNHRPLSTLPEPSKIVMLWTGESTTICAQRYPTATSGGDWEAVSPLNWETIPYAGRMNWLFADGHVERGKPSDYYLPEKFSQGRYWDWRDAAGIAY
jgi:prepilin-type N-terminal cleavage/methylation domain-containing protein/prepilin-type processing-associated H-X9-DG protein